MTLPTDTVRKVIDDGLGEVTRRVEIYESDAVTLWNAEVGSRLQEGSVTVNYGDNERRTVDVTLRNDDNLLRSQPGGFWYDKVLKLYRGVSWNPALVEPTAAIIEAQGGEAAAFRLAGTIARSGIPNAIVRLDVPSFSDLLAYDTIVSFTGTNATTNPLLLQELYNAGKNVITISVANGTSVVPFFASQTNVSETIGISQPATATALSPGWTTEARGVGTGPFPTALQHGATSVSRYQLGSSAYVITGSIGTNAAGGKWFDLHLPSVNATQTLILFANGIKWIRGIGTLETWETQIGEFVIDGINGDYFPSSVKVTGRDYVKRVVNSKVETAVSFAADTSLYTFVRAIASNAGIRKFRLANMTETLGTIMSFDRGTPRWDIIRQAAHAHGYEIFFDPEGYLVTRKFLDPTLSAESNVFSTGTDGNLATLTRSVNDTRIYNHVVVYGDPPSGEERMPYYGVAINTEPSSPTNVDRIGDRYYSYASTFFTSSQQCQEYADRLLKLHALESFELSFTSINYPWMEAGEIARVIDPKAVATDPTKYLVDSITIPLALGPMSFTGKRVTIVG
jgi:hypothetical protein